MSEVFNDRRVCDKCDKVFLMATETEDFIEGRSNPDINDEMVEGVYCFDCIEEMEVPKEELKIVPCENGVGEWEIVPLFETFDTRSEAETRLKELKGKNDE